MPGQEAATPAVDHGRRLTTQQVKTLPASGVYSKTGQNH